MRQQTVVCEVCLWLSGRVIWLSLLFFNLIFLLRSSGHGEASGVVRVLDQDM